MVSLRADNRLGENLSAKKSSEWRPDQDGQAWDQPGGMLSVEDLRKCLQEISNTHTHKKNSFMFRV